MLLRQIETLYHSSLSEQLVCGTCTVFFNSEGIELFSLKMFTPIAMALYFN